MSALVRSERKIWNEKKPYRGDREKSNKRERKRRQMITCERGGEEGTEKSRNKGKSSKRCGVG